MEFKDNGPKSENYTPYSSVIHRSHVEEILSSFAVTPAEHDQWVEHIEDEVNANVRINPESGTVFLRHLLVSLDVIRRITTLARALTEAMRKHPPTGIIDPGEDWRTHTSRNVNEVPFCLHRSCAGAEPHLAGLLSSGTVLIEYFQLRIREGIAVTQAVLPYRDPGRYAIAEVDNLHPQ